jgi:tetraacyldisaccharide 4'-kinase
VDFSIIIVYNARCSGDIFAILNGIEPVKLHMFFLEPKFWQNNNLYSRLLAPAAWGYEKIGKWMYRRACPQKLSIPVICVGNLVMGGAGKTPTVIALVDMLQAMGHTPHILSRGYGAVIKDSILVDPDYHNYLQVGDEALLLAKKAPTWAGHNRLLSAQRAIKQGATIILMDDGLQNNTLHKDFAILVVDTLQGFGNGKVFPAGPLRESPKNGVRKADLILAVGDGALPKGIPSAIRAHIKADSLVEPKSVMAFAGLGYPEKFNRTLLSYGYDVKKFIPFPDHHPYTVIELDRLVKLAKRRKLELITTAKDFLRIPEHFKKHVTVFPVHLEIEQPSLIKESLLAKLPQLTASNSEIVASST